MITLAPHLQRALDLMSKDMAVDQQALVNQAVFAWLRINGYVLPGAAQVVAPVVVAPAPLSAIEVPVIAAVVRAPSAPSAPAPAPAPIPVPDPEPVVAPTDLGPALLRMSEIDADLEKLTKPWAAWAPVQEEKDEEDEAEEEAPPEDDAEAPEEEEEPAAAAPPEEAPEPGPVAPPAEEPEEQEDPGLDANTGETDMDQEAPADSTIVLRSVPITLYLEREGEEPIRITQDRFIIGRGPHCDLVIDSPRVSREHVALTRSGILFFIEDLNSSNGTWFGEERVTKRELESGDVINLGNEPVTFFLRGE